MDQQATTKEMLDNHGLMEANGVRVPIGEEANGVEKEPMLLTKVPRRRGEPTIRNFQSLVGSLLWIARCFTYGYKLCSAQGHAAHSSTYYE